MNNKLVFVLSVFVVFALGALFGHQGIFPINKSNNRVEPGQLHSGQYDWTLIATFTTATTTPGNDSRDYDSFVADGNNAVYAIPSSWNGVKYICIGDVNNASVVYDVFYLHSEDTTYTNDDFIRAATHTWTIGAQEWSADPNYAYADTLAITNDDGWSHIWKAASPAADYIAQGSVDGEGASLIGVSPTTVDANTYIYITGFF